MENKLFTLEEANNALLDIRTTLERIFGYNQRIKTLTKDIQELFSIWGEELLDTRNVDHAYYAEKFREREARVRSAHTEVENIQQRGGIVRDVEVGLIDFCSSHEGEAIMLCWRYGEESIQYWHGINSGYTGRRSIAELRKLRSAA